MCNAKRKKFKRIKHQLKKKNNNSMEIYCMHVRVTWILVWCGSVPVMVSFGFHFILIRLLLKIRSPTNKWRQNVHQLWPNFRNSRMFALAQNSKLVLIDNAFNLIDLWNFPGQCLEQRAYTQTKFGVHSIVRWW